MTRSTARGTAAGDLGREPHPVVLDLDRLAGDDDDAARPARDGAHEAQHGLRIHRVRVDHLAVLDAGGDLGLLGLEHVERAGRAVAAHDVDQDERVVAPHHLVGEIEATGAEVLDRHARLGLALLEHPHDLGTEAVVAHERVADPCDQDLRAALRHDASRSSSSPAKKKRNRPVSRISCCPGSSSTVTPKYSLSS